MSGKRDASPKRGGSMSAGYCFTMNNYKDKHVSALKAMTKVGNFGIQYLVFGKEVGKEGTPHLQGYIHFKNRKRFNTVQKMFVENAKSAHLSHLRGTPEQAANYCKKDGDVWEWGELPVQEPGKRNDLIEIKKQMDGGKSADDISRMDEYFGQYIRYHRGFERYESNLVTERAFKSQVVVIYGDPGTFKSYSTSRFNNVYEVVRPSGKNQPVWYDGYNPREHTTVSFDDFYGWMPFNSLLQLCDRYACRVQAKGRTIPFRPAFVTFTSNVAPEEWYKSGSGVVYGALERRLDFVAEHRRVEAANDHLGLQPGDITVTIRKGRVGMHPLTQYLTPLGGSEEFFKLAPPFEEMNTQMDQDVLNEIYQEAMKGGLGEVPNAQGSLTASQIAFIDLVENASSSASIQEVLSSGSEKSSSSSSSN